MHGFDAIVCLLKRTNELFLHSSKIRADRPDNTDDKFVVLTSRPDIK
jgi:hypothetical protein